MPCAADFLDHFQTCSLIADCIRMSTCPISMKVWEFYVSAKLESTQAVQIHARDDQRLVF